MKKFLALLLVCLMAFAVVSCDKGEPAPTTPTVEVTDFAAFKTAIDQTPAASVSVNTVMTTDFGALKSNIVTIFNPNGSATVNYYIEKFNTGFDGDTIVPFEASVTLNSDGSYSDSGEFQGLLAGSVASVNLNLDATKLTSYTIDGETLSAVVNAENTAAVFGAAIAADVSFNLTIANGRVVSVILNYTTSVGTIKSIISYT